MLFFYEKKQKIYCFVIIFYILIQYYCLLEYELFFFLIKMILDIYEFVKSEVVYFKF